MMSTAILLILSARSIDLSALESASNSLETRLDSLESRLLVASVLVGAGVLIECWPDALEFLRELRWPMARFPREKFWPLIGGILVAVGVIGEFWYTGQISNKETTLRGNSHQIEAALNVEAQEANERSRNLEHSTTQLKLDLARQEQETAEAAKEAALANAKLGGWKLDDAAKKRFAEQVKKFPGTPFDLAVNPIEAPFMEELDALLTSPSVGWVRLPPKPTGNFISATVDNKASVLFVSGILLEVDQDQIASLKPEVLALGKAIHDELGVKKVAIHLVPSGS